MVALRGFSINFNLIITFWLPPTHPPTSFQIYLFTLLLSFCDALLPSQFTQFPSTIFFFLLTSATHLISFFFFFLFLFFIFYFLFFKSHHTISDFFFFFASFSDLLHHFHFLLFFSHFKSMLEFQIRKQISSQTCSWTDLRIERFSRLDLSSSSSLILFKCPILVYKKPFSSTVHG